MRTDSLRGARTLRLLSLFVAGALAWPTGVRAHVDDPMLLQECGSCHVGHGVSGQPMLGEVEEEVCFRCHGADEARTREIAAGNLAAGAELQDSAGADVFQRLRVSIGTNEVNAFHVVDHHVLEGVSATAANADDFDYCVLGNIIDKFEHGLSP